MKILLIDHDDVSNRLIRSKLEPLGHQVGFETDKTKAIELLTQDPHNLIFLDPSPLTSPKPIILNIRRAVQHYPYIVLLSRDFVSQHEAIKNGTNDVASKPCDTDTLDRILENARRFTKLVKHIGDDSEDFPSAGGVIAKSAFNQLFLSAIDRADRYGEKTYMLFITIRNYQDLISSDGQYGADYTVAKLCKYIVHLRRQSDIIGQTGANEYALLLQRPVYETEPIEAANRFAESLQKFTMTESSVNLSIEIGVTLVDLPVGAQLADHTIILRPTS